MWILMKGYEQRCSDELEMQQKAFSDLGHHQLRISLVQSLLTSMVLGGSYPYTHLCSSKSWLITPDCMTLRTIWHIYLFISWDFYPALLHKWAQGRWHKVSTVYTFVSFALEWITSYFSSTFLHPLPSWRCFIFKKGTIDIHVMVIVGD